MTSGVVLELSDSSEEDEKPIPSVSKIATVASTSAVIEILDSDEEEEAAAAALALPLPLRKRPASASFSRSTSAEGQPATKRARVDEQLRDSSAEGTTRFTASESVDGQPKPSAVALGKRRATDDDLQVDEIPAVSTSEMLERQPSAPIEPEPVQPRGVPQDKAEHISDSEHEDEKSSPVATSINKHSHEAQTSVAQAISNFTAMAQGSRSVSPQDRSFADAPPVGISISSDDGAFEAEPAPSMQLDPAPMIPLAPIMPPKRMRETPRKRFDNNISLTERVFGAAAIPSRPKLNAIPTWSQIPDVTEEDLDDLPVVIEEVIANVQSHDGTMYSLPRGAVLYRMPPDDVFNGPGPVVVKKGNNKAEVC